MNEQETIADIIAEMRRGTRLPGYWRSCDVNKILQYHADRLEAAHKRERGDAAKLREALELCAKCMCGYCIMDAEARGMSTECVNGCEALRKAKAALSAPPRNCDVGTAEEQAKRKFEFRQKQRGCCNCPFDKGPDITSCVLAWAQMTYVKEEGGAE